MTSASSRSAPIVSIDGDGSVSRGGFKRPHSFVRLGSSSLSQGASSVGHGGDGATSFASFNAALKKNSKQKGGATSRRFVFTASDKDENRFAKAVTAVRGVQKSARALKAKSPASNANAARRASSGLLGMVAKNRFGKNPKKRKALFRSRNAPRPKVARSKTA
jgi:hypothetical protein